MKKFLVVLTLRDEDAYSDTLQVVQASDESAAVDLVLKAARGSRVQLYGYAHCSARLLNEVLAQAPIVELE